MKRYLKLALAIVVLLVTIVLFVRYAISHPDVIHKIGDLSPGKLAALLFLYAMWFVSISLVLFVSLKMYGKTIHRKENLLLNAYSSLVNFFGPGQSGPAFRGIYLRKRHDFAL